MKRTFNAIIALCMLLASMAFAITEADTTIMGVGYAKVESCDDLGQIRTWTNKGTVVNAILMNDVDCGNDGFKPIGQSESYPYNGTFNGNGKTIFGLNPGEASWKSLASDGWSYVTITSTAMFGVIGPVGVVKNLTIAKSSISGASSQYVGLLVGLNYGLVTNCEVDASNTVYATGGTDVGGIAGRNGGYGTMSGCTNRAAVTGGTHVGGIAGACTGAIDNSVNYGDITGGTYAGGITGSVHYRTARTLTSGIDSTFVPGRIALCQNIGDVSAASYAGGIAGENKSGTIDNTRNDGSVEATVVWGNSSYAGGIVGYSHFADENDNRNSMGGYYAVVSNSFSTTSSVTGTVSGGVVGLVKGKKNKSSYSKVVNSYYDSDKLSGAKAVGSSSNSTVTSVSGKTTEYMFANDEFVVLLNSGSDYMPWLFDDADYPVLNFGANHGSFKVVFLVEGKPYYDGTTVKGRLAGQVSNPDVSGFDGWLDGSKKYTSAEANARIYTKSVVYNAVIKPLYEITFVAKYEKDMVVTLGTKYFQEGDQIFYYDEDRDSETPADYETADATYKFTGWDKKLGPANGKDTLTALFDKVRKTFSVKFYVLEKMVLDEVVEAGKDATPPADPDIEHLEFRGWKGNYKEVAQDEYVYAEFVNLINVCFEYPETKDCKEYPEDGEIEIPENPTNEKYTCSDWLDANNKPLTDKVIVKDVVVKGVVNIKAACEINKYEVAFYYPTKDDFLTSVKEIEYGTSIVDKVPTPEEDDEYRFDGWDVEEGAFDNITSSFDVVAKVTKKIEVCIDNVVDGEDGKKCEKLPEDEVIDIPEVPESDKYTCSNWMDANGKELTDKVVVKDIVVEGVANIVAACKINKYVVSFYYPTDADHLDNDIVDVEYGTSVKESVDALKPADTDDYRFDSWNVKDEVISNVTSDLKIVANVTKKIEVCIDNVVDGEDGKKCEKLPEDEVIDIPEVPESDKYTCSNWMDANGKPLTGSVIVKDVVVDGVANIVAACKINKYVVSFYYPTEADHLDNDIVDVEYGTSVKEMVDALKPADTDDYRFDGWNVKDEVASNVTSDLKIVAKVTKKVDVCFVDAENNKNCEKKPVDEEIVIPGVPNSNKYSCSDWKDANGKILTDKVVVNEIIVDGVANIIAVCEINKYDVTFYYPTKDVWYAEMKGIDHGSSISAPKPEDTDDYRFDGWDVAEDAFESITDDMKVYANVTPKIEVCFEFAGEQYGECEKIPEDEEVDIPEALPGNDSLTCDAWTVNGEAVKGSVPVKGIEKIVAQCKVNEFKVDFVVLGKTLKHVENVKYGSKVDAPEVSVSGYRFDEWNTHAYLRVTEDLMVLAGMTPMTLVCFEFAGATTGCSTTPSESEVVLPKLPGNDSLTCDAWMIGDVAYEAGATITAALANSEKITARCKVNEFDVLFYVLNEQYGEKQSIKYGSAAVAPEVDVPGYRFERWDSEFSRVTTPLNVNAVMTAMSEVCFEFAGETKCSLVPTESEVDIPEVPGNDSLTCDAWTINGEVVTGKVPAADAAKIVARCKVNEYDVKFFAFEEQVGETQKVSYGAAAEAPEAPKAERFRFTKWDKDFSSVKENLDVTAIYDTLVKVSVTVESNEVVVLDSSIFVLKDTTVYGLKSMIDTYSGELFSCEEIAVEGATLSDTIVASNDINVKVSCSLLPHLVKFYVEEKLIGSKIVMHGKSTSYDAPALPNKRFVKWDKDLSEVLENMDVNGIYVEVDSIFVVVNGEPVDTIVVDKGETVDYVLPEVKDTNDSTFTGWLVNDEKYKAGETVAVKGGDVIVASFDEITSIHQARAVAGFSVKFENGALQIVGAKIGTMIAVFDLNGHVVAQQRVRSSAETLKITNRGTYLVRVGNQAQRVTVR